MTTISRAFTIDLAGLGREDLLLAGGKGANLGAMLRAGLPVPPGFCITSEAYRAVVAPATPFITAHLSNLDVDDNAALDAASAAIRAEIEALPVPEEIAAAVADGYAALVPTTGAAPPPVAVRSSATAEDLPDASFAGQQETFLNIRGEEALLQAVKRCWSSLWTPRAIAYRQRNSFDHSAVALAVVVQSMIDADVSGVLFTADPVSGNRTHMMVNASWGLGEAIVSGMVSPDGWVLDRKGQILHEERARKEKMVVYDTAGGAVEREVPPELQEKLCLTPAQLRQLAALGQAAERYFGAPQDLEWALHGVQFYLLQSRPITTLFPVPRPRPADGELHVYLSFNAMQGIIEPITPMGRSILDEIAALIQSITNVRGTPRGRSKLFAEAAGRVYFDATPALRHPLTRRLAQVPFGLIDPTTAYAFPTLFQDPRLALRPLAPLATAAVAGKLLWKARWFLLRFARSIVAPEPDRAWEVIARRMQTTERLSRRSMTLAERVLIVRVLLRAVAPAIPAILIPAFGPGLLASVIAERLVRRWGLDVAQVAALRQGLPGNPTTEMDLALWGLSQRIKADPEARSLFSKRPPEEVARAYEQSEVPPVAQAGLHDFLERYGHRGVREIDVGMPRWSETPDYIINTIRNYLLLDDPALAPDARFAALARRAEQAQAELVRAASSQRGGLLKAAVLRFLVGRMRALMGGREAPKFWIVRMLALIRQILYGAGEELVRRGLLKRADDVFFLQLHELDSIEGRDGGRLRTLASERRAAYTRELKREQLPRIITSEGEIIAGRPPSTDPNALTGVGVSPGSYEGVARVIRDPHGAHLAPGEILVAPSTDPAWTPLFMTAGGLVMEAGGTLSHGSVVAREYGIPAVVGVAGATARLQTGYQIRVDGTAGTVETLAAQSLE